MKRNKKELKGLMASSKIISAQSGRDWWGNEIVKGTDDLGRRWEIWRRRQTWRNILNREGGAMKEANKLRDFLLQRGGKILMTELEKAPSLEALGARYWGYLSYDSGNMRVNPSTSSLVFLVEDGYVGLRSYKKGDHNGRCLQVAIEPDEKFTSDGYGFCDNFRGLNLRCNVSFKNEEGGEEVIHIYNIGRSGRCYRHPEDVPLQDRKIDRRNGKKVIEEALKMMDEDQREDDRLDALMEEEYLKFFVNFLSFDRDFDIDLLPEEMMNDDYIFDDYDLDYPASTRSYHG